MQVRDGYETALRTIGIAEPPIDPIDLYLGALDMSRVEAAAVQLAEAVAEGKVTAALVLSDTDAILLVQQLRAMEPQLKVPEDVAIVAYDDEVAALSDLPLTAVAPPKYEVGQAAVHLLLRRIREAADAPGRTTARRHLALLPELRVRRSCGAGPTG